MTVRDRYRAQHEGHTPDHATDHGGHRWMMIACCIPMIVIDIALVATGVVGAGFLVVALACTAMMWFMMRGMGGMGGMSHETDPGTTAAGPAISRAIEAKKNEVRREEAKE